MRRILITHVLALAITAAAALAGPIGYAVNLSAQVGMIDLGTGAHRG